jgi:hypothetical protein
MISDVLVFALLHSPLVGSSTWVPVADQLRDRGHDAITPTLEAPEHDDRGPYWRRHAAAFARAVSEVPGDAAVVLVAHSGAGPLLPAVKAAMGRSVAGYTFVDASLPRAGASRLEVLAREIPPAAAGLRELLDAGGRYPTWADHELRASIPDAEIRRRVLDEVRPRSAKFWTEPIPVPQGWPDAPCAYLRLSPAYDVPAAEARQRGWPVRELDADHFHMLVDASAVTDALLSPGEKLD